MAKRTKEHCEKVARDALGKRYPEIADRARMVELAAWGRGLTK